MQTVERQLSPIGDKEQNCNIFGAYESDSGFSRTRKMCHGGWIGGDHFEPCPVRDECEETSREPEYRDLLDFYRKDYANRDVEQYKSFPGETSVTPGTPPATYASVTSLFGTEPYKRPVLSELEVTTPLPRTPRPLVTPPPASTTVEAAVKAAEEATKAPVPDLKPVHEKLEELFAAASTVAAETTQPPEPHMPKPDAPPGLQTPFFQDPGAQFMAPTFLPRPGQSTFGRLLRNIVQGVIAAIGYAIWSFARRIDLFG